MVGHTQIVHAEIVYGSRVSDDQIEGVAFGVCGDINVLSEVETIQDMEKFRCEIT